MTSVASSATFTPPGHGQWNLDRSHFAGAATPIVQWLMEQSMEAGMRTVFAELGTPADAMRARFVNGFMYTRLLPLIGPEKAPRPLPPKPILKFVAHVHPSFRRRARAAAAIETERPWVAVTQRWERELRPSLVTTNSRFSAVDLARLSDAELDRHISGLLDHCRQTFEQHFWLHGYDLGPLANYLWRVIGWGGSPEDALSALAGASPSTSAPSQRLARVRAELTAHGVRAKSLEEVRATSPEAARLLDEHLAAHGDHLVTSYDLDGFTLRELPSTVLASINDAVVRTPIDHVAAAAKVRAQVPASEQATFDQLLADARLVMDLRDDNGPNTIEWPLGLVRLALLEAGQRLRERSYAHEPMHVFEASHSEARTLCSSGGPGADVLAARAVTRETLRAIDPPVSIGPVELPPPLDVLPKPLPDMVAMVQTAVTHLGMDGTTRRDPFTGAGIGTEIYIGRVRRAASAEDAIMTLEPGDVLVVRATSPAFNSVLSIAGAVVTADGGVMSHAAVLARELGIAAVVGARGALDLPDGATVEVNPVTGRVRVLS
jgi:rifampicin phosphotransferase